MPRFGQAYQDLCDAQQILKQLLANASQETMTGAAACAREFREIEVFKREIRGIPRLKSLEIPMKRIGRNRSTMPSDAPLEVQATLTPSEPSPLASASPAPEAKQS